MAADDDREVVVGVDGSEASGRAAQWAARWAMEGGLALRLVHVIPWNPVSPAAHGELPYHASAVPQLMEEAVKRAQKKVAAAEAVIRTEFPGLDVRTGVVEGNAAEHFVTAAQTAALVVVGTRGWGPLMAMVMGSVADNVVTHARGPVAVVPGAPTGHGTEIVVAVDPDSVPVGAVEFALAAAARRGVGVTLLYVAAVPQAAYDVGMATAMFVPSRELNERNETSVRAAVVALTERYPEVPVTVRTEYGDPSTAVAEHTQHAKLVVVGNRGRGGFEGLLLGSTSRRLLQRTEVPVVVVRNPQAGRHDS